VLADLNKLISSIFNLIFVHRFKDSQPVIRQFCVNKLTKWLLQDPVHYYQEEYLKYIGVLTFDPSSEVRRAALQALGQLLTHVDVDVDDESLKSIRLIVERFTERFIEIASGYIVDLVSLEMFYLFRKLQSLGYLDHI
jgi:cohesin complex subunit SA-1/2